MQQTAASPDRFESVRALAFDLDGTVYLDGNPLPGALELLAELRRAAVPHLFVTNNSSASSAAYLHKLAALGLEPDPEQVITSNDVARSHLHEAGIRRPYLLATPAVRLDYANEGLLHEEAEPDAVVLTFDTSLDFAKLSSATKHIAAGLPYLATHPDVTCPVPGGFLPDTGSFIELFFAATGRRPRILGKPHDGMISEILRRLDLPAGNIAFVGDRLTTDILMARNAGFVGVLTLTGVTEAGSLGSSNVQPDATVSGLGELHELLQRTVLVR